MVPVVSIGHSFILVTLTSAMGCVWGDMVVQVAGGMAWCLWWWGVGADMSLLVDESVSENADGNGDSEAR